MTWTRRNAPAGCDNCTCYTNIINDLGEEWDSSGRPNPNPGAGQMLTALTMYFEHLGTHLAPAEPPAPLAQTQQWLELWGEAGEEQLRILDQVVAAGRRANRCFLDDHERRIEQLTAWAERCAMDAAHLRRVVCALITGLGIDPRDIPEDCTPELRWTNDGLVLHYEAYVREDGRLVIDPDTNDARREMRTAAVTRPQP